MSEVDLDIENYELEDILNLFRLQYNFVEADLKRAYRMALKLHPDKSGLDGEYFRFYMKAYKIVENIFNFRNRKKKCAYDVVYNSKETDISEDKAVLLHSLNGKSIKEFNKWFNEMFEKVRVKDEDLDTGYGTWFKSNEDINEENVKSVSAMGDAFERQKKKSKALIKHQGIRDLEIGGGYGLTREKPLEYGSDIFSNLQYEDLKKAHTETVVPVTMEDYLVKPKFESVESYMRYREQHRPDMVSLEQSRQMMKQRNMKNDKVNTERAFRLIKRDEEIAQSNKKWWANLKQLDN